VLVKDLQGVETLGSLTLLAAGGTGTLTCNQTTVTNLWSGGRMYSVFQGDNDEDGITPFTLDALDALDAHSMPELVDVAVLNCKIKFHTADTSFVQRETLGDTTETSLTRFAGRGVPKYDAHLKADCEAFEVLFNSTNKQALVIVSVPACEAPERC
jgi:sodium/potassium-transporting ATPase subunit alpha